MRTTCGIIFTGDLTVMCEQDHNITYECIDDSCKSRASDDFKVINAGGLCCVT